jgi:hypothetical protein
MRSLDHGCECGLRLCLGMQGRVPIDQELNLEYRSDAGHHSGCGRGRAAGEGCGLQCDAGQTIAAAPLA